MKTVSVAALAIVYLRAPLDLASLAVIAGGILLNIRAAAALGLDRTYYGHEVAGLPARRITGFPYSLTSHPMILGNVAAFGGTLINADFRQHGGRWRACMSRSTSDCWPWSWPARGGVAPSGSAAASSWAAPCSAPSSAIARGVP